MNLVTSMAAKQHQAQINNGTNVTTPAPQSTTTTAGQRSGGAPNAVSQQRAQCRASLLIPNQRRQHRLLMPAGPINFSTSQQSLSSGSGKSSKRVLPLPKNNISNGRQQERND